MFGAKPEASHLPRKAADCALPPISTWKGICQARHALASEPEIHQSTTFFQFLDPAGPILPVLTDNHRRPP